MVVIRDIKPSAQSEDTLPVTQSGYEIITIRDEKKSKFIRYKSHYLNNLSLNYTIIFSFNDINTVMINVFKKKYDHTSPFATRQQRYCRIHAT